jgi:hypothetical protein
MGRVELGQIFLPVRRFPLPILISLIVPHSSYVIIGQIVADVTSGFSLARLQEIEEIKPKKKERKYVHSYRVWEHYC